MFGTFEIDGTWPWATDWHYGFPTTNAEIQSWYDTTQIFTDFVMGTPMVVIDEATTTKNDNVGLMYLWPVELADPIWYMQMDAYECSSGDSYACDCYGVASMSDSCTKDYHCYDTSNSEIHALYAITSGVDVDNCWDRDPQTQVCNSVTGYANDYNLAIRSSLEEAQSVQCFYASYDGEGDCGCCSELMCDGCGAEPLDGCTSCHNTAQGSRRQVVDDDGDGQGDFSMTSSHISGEPTDSDCKVCHYTANHESGTVMLIDPDDGMYSVYSYDPNDPSGIEEFCVGCHDAAGAIRLLDPTSPFSDAQTPTNIAGHGWSSSAHNNLAYAANNNAPISCMGDGSTTGCHGSGHGTDNVALVNAAAGEDLDDFCFNCHTQGGVENPAISGADLADDIEEAFSSTNVHDLGASFTASSSTHTMQCTTCHNPHVVTGGYWDASSDLTPVTLPNLGGSNDRAMGTDLYGDTSGEKMEDYAAGENGVYVRPNGTYDSFDDDAMPDYATFCLTCHQDIDGLNDISWSSDMHGGRSAGAQSRDGGTCPNWWACGKAVYWDLDECDETQYDCFPVLPSGRGRTTWTRPTAAWELTDAGYSPTQRNLGVNYVMSCTDCHEAHGGPYRMMRSSVNGRGNNPNDWNGTDGICNACHWQRSDWHAGMSCGNASCHVSNSIHGMGSSGTVGPTTTFATDLVVSMDFERNLLDSGDFNLDGRWSVSAGSYVSGANGYGIEVSDNPVEVGTEDSYWSTDAGRHGTWKFTEMKYNMTLEGWVYPTDSTRDTRYVIAKHTYWTGGYTLVLERVGGTYRAALMTNMTGGAPDYGAWDGSDCNGLRGAYSTVHVPLDEWTHIAAVFDPDQPDRDATDASVGRVRIYVNGEDVTTSSADEYDCFAQPAAGEDAMWPQSDHSPANEAYCYAGHWCASALSLGGVNWSAADNFVGRLDELQIWNITKGAAYFEEVDEVVGPRVDLVEGTGGSDELTVTFSEEVYGLSASDFVFTDLDDGRSVTSVSHTDGDTSATVYLSSALDGVDDFYSDTLAFAAASVTDEYNNAGDTLAVEVTGSSCPTSGATFNFAEAAGSSTLWDDQLLMYGSVNDPAQTLLGDDLFTGDGSNNYVAFSTSDTCLQATTDLTLEVRFRPDVVDNGGSRTIQRLFDRSGRNWQISVWRNTNNYWGPTFNPPSGVASLAFWLKPPDNHGGTNWKLMVSDYDACPIQAGHWYRAEVTWDHDMGGVVGQPFVPGTIYIDDQGTDGYDSGEEWSGYIDCTDADQSQLPTNKWLYTNDTLSTHDTGFYIGNNANLNKPYDGVIDWIYVDNSG